MTTTITFTVSGRRPEYLDHTMASWSRARGAKTAHVIAGLEPGGDGDQVLRYFPHATLLTPAEQFGCDGNTFRVLDYAFKACGADFVISAEEDTEVSADALEYFAWCRDRFMLDDVGAACAGSWNHVCGAVPEVAALTRPTAFWGPCWGTWRRSWGFLGPHWDDLAHGQWDMNVIRQFGARGQSVITPCLPRAVHTGRASSFGHRGGALSPRCCFREVMPPVSYRLAEAPAVLLGPALRRLSLGDDPPVLASPGVHPQMLGGDPHMASLGLDREPVVTGPASALRYRYR